MSTYTAYFNNILIYRLRNHVTRGGWFIGKPSPYIAGADFKLRRIDKVYSCTEAVLKLPFDHLKLIIRNIVPVGTYKSRVSTDNLRVIPFVKIDE